MAFTSISTATTDTLNMDGDDILLITQGGSITETQKAIDISGTNNAVTILGTIVVTGTAAAVFTGNSSTGNSITIGSTGSVYANSSSYGAVNVEDTGHVINHGAIYGELAVLLNGLGSTLVNTGLINSTSFPDEHAFMSAVLFMDGASLVNSGTITSMDAGVQDHNGSFGQTLVVTNSGDITGDVAVQFDTYISGAAIVTNTGNLTGTSGVAVETARALEMSNSGMVNGDIEASGATDMVVNSGNVIGDVRLAAGSDTYDGRGGTVLGSVSGGTGDDVFLMDGSSNAALVELADEGIDEVRAQTGWILGDHFENLSLIGNGDWDGIGNGLANVMGGNSGHNRLEGDNGADQIDGGAGNDTILGGNGSDDLDGGSGDDVLRGGNGVDAIDGGKGDDVLRGGSGDDALEGGNGNDTLTGGRGKDILSGGDGDDVFVFNRLGHSKNDATADVIEDFEQGFDLIDLSGLGDLAFLGAGGFSGAGMEARVQTSGGNSIVRVDSDGDGASDFKVTVTGVSDLTEADFLL